MNKRRLNVQNNVPDPCLKRMTTMMILKLLNMIWSMTVILIKAEPKDHNDSEDILTFLRGLTRSGRMVIELLSQERRQLLRLLCNMETR